jgi:putative ABC transport system permease protein
VVINNVGTEDFDFKKFRAFKERLLLNPKILHATAAMAVPGAPFLLASAEFSKEETPHERVRMRHNVVDYDFAATMGIGVIAGREFTADRTTEEKTAMLNESAVKSLGLVNNENAVGKTVLYHWSGVEGTIELKIVGVVSDVSNTTTAGTSARPEIYMFANTAWPYGLYNFYIVHVSPNNLQETIEQLEEEWEKTFPQAPFEYTFQDQLFQRLFERDEKIRSVAGISTGLSIFIACMGLAGLVAFSVSQRIKEIGIRKTLGASISQVLVLLSSEFLLLILIAIILAIPIARFAAKQFLENYEFRIELSLSTFLIPCLLLFLIAIVTISFQTIRAARSNPVKALRYE